jgi:cell division protease FtsH
MSSEDKSDKESSPQKFPLKHLAIWFLIIAVMVTFFQFFQHSNGIREKMKWGTFTNLVEEKKISRATLVSEGHGVYYITGELTEHDAATGDFKKFRVDFPYKDVHAEWLMDHAPFINYEVQSPYVREILAGFLPFLLLLGLLYFLFVRQMRMAGKGAMNFGKSRAKLLTRTKNKITFKDVAGVEEAKEEVEEIIEFLKDPKKFQKLGGRIPKGVLLMGPPGTGKTLIAKAVASEAEVPFFSISGSDFVEMFVGVGASRVRDMFEQGRKNAPCIVFIDEIDAVGRSRFSGIGGGHDEREQTLNALLVEMDGFDTQEGVIIVAATNRPDVLDNALLRPGRFDRQIMVDLPSLNGRTDILEIHARKIKLKENVNLKQLARGTPGFSGADLANLVNESALYAARRGAESVDIADLEEARDKVRMGPERRSRLMDDHEKKLTAYHEAGHALVFADLEHAEPVHKVTIIPRGAALGLTMQLPEKDAYTQSKKKLEAMLIGLMGGRAAEELAMDDITTGASSDIERATSIARSMVCQFGMNDRLGPQSFHANEEHLWLGREVTKTEGFSEQTAMIIDEEISSILQHSYAEAIRILTEKRAELDTMSQLLLERETINGRDVVEILKYNRILSPEERAELEPESVEEPPPPLSGEAIPVDEPESEDVKQKKRLADEGDAPIPDPSPA